MTKLLHCITGLSKDGAQRMLLRVVRGLIDQGFSQLVVSLSDREDFASRFEELNVPVVSLAMRRGMPDPRRVARLFEVVQQASPDIMQGWMYHGNLAVSLVRPLLRRAVTLTPRKAPLVVWNVRRGLDDLRERKLLTRLLVPAGAFLSHHVDKIIYCTAESADQHERAGFAASKRILIGNGFDSERFRPRPEARSRLLSELSLDDDALLVGNVGRADVAKGHGNLVEAFAGVLFSTPNARLILVGRGVDASNRELRQLISRRGLSSRVFLLGERSSLEELFPAFDVYCSASLAEGFPNVIAEAMACGVPCVVTDTGASRSLVHGVGIVVPTRSVEQLSKGLLRMLMTGHAERKEIGRQLRERIERDHSLTKVVASYASLYRDLCAGGLKLQQAA